MKLVIAPTRQRFMHWCRQQGVSPYDSHTVRQVSSLDTLRGWPPDAEVVLLGFPQQLSPQQVQAWQDAVRVHEVLREVLT